MEEWLINLDDAMFPAFSSPWSLSVLSRVLPLTLAPSSLQASLSTLFQSSHQATSTLLVPSRLQAPLSPLAPSSSHTLSSSPRESTSPQSFCSGPASTSAPLSPLAWSSSPSDPSASDCLVHSPTKVLRSPCSTSGLWAKDSTSTCPRPSSSALVRCHPVLTTGALDLHPFSSTGLSIPSSSSFVLARSGYTTVLQACGSASALQTSSVRGLWLWVSISPGSTSVGRLHIIKVKKNRLV